MAKVVPLFLAFTLAVRASPNEDRNAYDAWVSGNKPRSLDGVALVVTVIEGESDTDRQQGIVYSSTVLADGRVRTETITIRAVSGGGGNKIAEQPLLQLKRLAASLPADTGRLPAAGRRLLIQTLDSTRVYDRAKLSDGVAELLRLSGCGFGSWVPSFTPHSEIDAGPGELNGFLALSPDAERLLFASARTLQFWDSTSLETLGDTRPSGLSLTSVAFSPDGKLSAMIESGTCQIVETRHWKPVQNLKPTPLFDPHFSPDGLHLVLRSGYSTLSVFDTRTWKVVEAPPEIPQHATQWLPAISWQRAVILTKSGAISLWDAKRKAEIELDKNVTLTAAAFSPDQTQVVVATADPDGYSHPRLRLFMTDTGQLVHELRNKEAGCEKFGFPQWSGDGHYILAATKLPSFFSSENISVWNPESGRHRGNFTGCPGDVYGLVQLPGGGDLVAGCEDGHIRFWDFAGAMKQIQLFEQSLAAMPNTPK